ncbi:MAG: hypothetical protein DRQ88_12680 [Epsilonproteobacteria bacterium]|nr:MAG: hypothetical protein DRQ89_12220 [Campylobacterota bacterium]RLA63264.1 MAG: hypothetical protein DRQ88_12680 [Campylobacterota bacterium]
MNFKYFLLILFISLPSFGKLSKWDQYPSSQIQYLTENKDFQEIYFALEKLPKNEFNKRKMFKLKGELNGTVKRYNLNLGKYQSIKNNLDHSYHGIYTKARQQFHDKIIDDYMKGMKITKSKIRPRVIFTAGPMGVGKGYALEKLNACTYPRGNFVTIDPDRIKNSLPEFKEQINLRKKLSAEIKAGAAGYVHKESGYLAEIIQEIAFKKKLNIIIDGSLKDLGWNRMLMKKFKATGYKIEIIYVNASSQIIMKRVKERAQKTGRDIPQDMVMKNINQVASTVKILSKERGLVDTFIEIDNANLPTIDSTPTKIPLTLPKCKIQVDKFLRAK